MIPAKRAKLKVRLSQVPAETLADTLLDLADWHEEIARIIEALTATPDEAPATFKRKLSGIKRRKTFYYRSQASAFGRELESLLGLLDKPEIPPREALKALVAFFESDAKLAEMADDSYGDIGYVFRQVATPLLAKVAARIDDQAFLIKTFKKLYENNDYGLRDSIVGHAAEFLTTDSLKQLRSHYQAQEPANDLDYQARILTKALSAQLADPESFEAGLKAAGGHSFQAHIIELAEIYQKAGRHAELAERLPEFFELINKHERTHLEDIAVATYQKVGQPELARELREKAFLRHPSKRTREALSTFVSSFQLANLDAQIRDSIKPKLDLSLLRYFIDSGQVDFANRYLLERAEQLDGDYYEDLPNLAKTFAQAGHPLAATLIYRALTTSILERAYTKAYPYGITYLTTAHELAKSITDWQGHPSHLEYLKSQHATHYRKASFWPKLPAEVTQSLW